MPGIRGWALAIGVAALAVTALAQPPAPAGPQFTTKVEGTVPDLAGRWLVASDLVGPQGEQVGTVNVLWEVTRVDGNPQVTVRWATLPPALEQAVATANQQKRAWEPSDGDLVQIRDAWSSLTPADRGATRVETTLTGKHAFTDVFKNDERMKDAQFVVQMVVLYAPGQGRPIKDALIYGALDETPDGYRGNYASVSVAAAPFPVPISFQGTFRMYRLDAVEHPGLLARVLGMFSGCGRSHEAGR